MFVDASALVAMIVGEPESGDLSSRMGKATLRRTSPIALFETATAVSRILAISLVDAEAAVDDLLGIASIRVAPIPIEAAALALEAFARYGKGRVHPAQLNMGDCFAYGCARYFEEPLLFKGVGFSRTDIEAA